MSLAGGLVENVRGDVRFDDGSRAVYPTYEFNRRRLPIGVMLPRDAEDVAKALEICRKHDAPITPRGAGTSLAGQFCNVAVVIDVPRSMNPIVEIDAERRTAR